jgi:catechol 2,3-dioxygenase-like lactoylglutathione lyase family enzyme
MATVRYFVGDVARAIQFYTEHLGFEVVEHFGEAIAITKRGDLTLWLAGPPSSAARPMPDGRKPEAGGWNRFVVEVEDIQAKSRELRERGLKFRNDIVRGPGGAQILLEDPFGNVIELFQPSRDDDQ